MFQTTIYSTRKYKERRIIKCLVNRVAQYILGEGECIFSTLVRKETSLSIDRARENFQIGASWCWIISVRDFFSSLRHRIYLSRSTKQCIIQFYFPSWSNVDIGLISTRYRIFPLPLVNIPKKLKNIVSTERNANREPLVKYISRIDRVRIDCDARLQVTSSFSLFMEIFIGLASDFRRSCTHRHFGCEQ